MKALLILVVLFSLLPAGTAAQQEKNGRPRAAEPTVVTVYGKTDPVEEQKPERKRTVVGKIGSGIKTGATKAWNGVVDLTGWLFNMEEVVPSDREDERERKETTKER